MSLPYCSAYELALQKLQETTGIPINCQVNSLCHLLFMVNLSVWSRDWRVFCLCGHVSSCSSTRLFSCLLAGFCLVYFQMPAHICTICLHVYVPSLVFLD